MLQPRVERAGSDERLVRDAMIRRPKALPADASVGDLRRLFENRHVVTALLVDGQAVVGCVERGALPADAADGGAAAAFASPPDTIGAGATLVEALARMDEAGTRRLVVVSGDGRTLEGLLCMTGDRAGFCVSG